MVFMLQAMEILSRVDGYLAVPLDPKTLLVPVLLAPLSKITATGVASRQVNR